MSLKSSYNCTVAMKQQKKQTKKMETVNKVNETKKVSRKADLSNLQKIAESMPKVETSGTTGSKEIYKDLAGLPAKVQKTERRKRRAKLDDFATLTQQALSAKNDEKAEKIYNEFLPFYQKHFTSNDFTVSSIRSNVKHDADKIRFELFMNCMKAIHETK